MQKTFCDTCEKLIKKNATVCDGCGDGEYHTSCLRRMNGNDYCKGCAERRIDGFVLASYLKKTLRGLKIGGKIGVTGVLDDHDSCRVYVEFGPDQFAFKATWIGWTKTLVLHHRSYYWRVKLHHHATFRRSLKEVMISVLFTELAVSKNTIKQHQYSIKEAEERHTRLTAVHKQLMGKEKFSPKGLVPHMEK